jgi:hypothetical protein
MDDNSTTLAAIEARLAAARENLRELIEQAAAYSGAGDEELMSARIEKQEAAIERLTQQRDDLLRAAGAGEDAGSSR